MREIMKPPGYSGESGQGTNVRFIFREEPVFYPGMYACTRKITRREVLQVDAAARIEKALEIMLREKIGTLPVTENGRVVGVVEAADLLTSCCKITAEGKVR